ncbi:hypothetical protein BXZ70DRAFT_369379 [Cristinia sonorae]|uniref:Uncharacterized protein n=1 Tax=Cristinia sonorae TaxID=1940300 RepID=A0A8K0UK52_9AGAR|nr:hypothetical protein BXZ70DRAFT_369379 [Cristinia sonorae]
MILSANILSSVTSIQQNSTTSTSVARSHAKGLQMSVPEQTVASGSGSRESDHNSEESNPRTRSNCPGRDDPTVSEILREYQRRNITNKFTLSQLLLAEHGIDMSPRTVVRRRSELGLKASGRTTRELSENEKRQLLLDQLAKDPGRTRGPRTIKEAIANETSVHLTRDWITQEMRRIDPTGFALRRPHVSRKETEELLPQGPHFAWTGYGYEKMSRIGFPIWCIRDSWTNNWLGMWVLPVREDRLAQTYRYMGLVKSLEGMPMQGTTPNGKDATLTYSLTHALREALTSEPVDGDRTVDRFLRRIEGVRAERGSAHLTFEWGDGMLAAWAEGEGTYNPDDSRHKELAHWLWSNLIQKELDNSRYTYNNHRSRKDNTKTRPTGVSPNIALALYAQHGGVNCLQNVNEDVVRHLMEDIGGEDLIRFVSKPFERRASVVLEALGVREVKTTNVWEIFKQMLPLL